MTPIARVVGRHSPIEPHHLVPFYQYWPRPAQKWVGERVLGYYDEVWLLDRKAVRALADAGDEIVVWEEKVLGIVKSFVLYKEDAVQTLEQDGVQI